MYIQSPCNAILIRETVIICIIFDHQEIIVLFVEMPFISFKQMFAFYYLLFRLGSYTLSLSSFVCSFAL